jgi:two-component system, chemotaxis family, protein-glutamate methylesterase/glutaminase
VTDPTEKKKIRILVVDDSAYNRRNIADVFSGVAEAEVVGKAADGEEALRLSTSLKPDVITLDLEMPRMDGFTFLRILMARQPTPVIVVSSYSQKENVFKALELGALDFVAKPDRQISPDATEVRNEILQKVLMVRNLRPTTAPQRSLRTSVRDSPTLPAPPPPGAPQFLIGIASSTGGPTALLEVFGRLPEKLAAAVLVAQHMPDKFTRTFAERLDKKGSFRVSEAQDGDLVTARAGFVCPGRQCMELFTAPNGDMRLKTGSAGSADRYVPSADRLLKSMAQVAGPKVVAVVLTGMGDDGLIGARAVREAGGSVIVESQETAVVYGMPGAVARAGLADQVLPLPQLAEYLASLGSLRKSAQRLRQRPHVDAISPCL